MTADIVLLTPPGRGAIATIVVVGEAANEVVARAIPSVRGNELNRPRLARIAIDGVDGDVSEGVVVCRVSSLAISSLANAPRWEVHCHGGTVIVEAVVAALEAAGGTRRDAKTWRDPELSPFAAEAVLALAECRTEHAAKILLDQYHGALESALKNDPAGVAAWREVGEHLTKPWRVVIAGLPNVGKSSLLNAVVGFDRAIVDAASGTTRDVVTHNTVVDGWWLELCDTAGLRNSTNQIESAGIELARDLVTTADLVVEVIDATAPHRDATLANIVKRRVILVANKVDLLDDAACASLANIGVDLCVSAKTGHGLPELAATIVRRLVPQEPPRGAGVPFGEVVGVVDSTDAPVR
ncbi:MAG: GTPase [Thermoguttaceae bacterium]